MHHRVERLVARDGLRGCLAYGMDKSCLGHIHVFLVGGPLFLRWPLGWSGVREDGDGVVVNACSSLIDATKFSPSLLQW